MSQGDQSIANQAGAAFRADLNLELQAAISLSSGATAPATTYAYQHWADTTTGLLKQRNSSNSAWVTVLEIDTGTLPSKTLTLPTITDYIETAPTAVNSGTAQTISLTAGTVLRYTMTGNCTFTMPAATAGKSFIAMLTQDGTGSRTAAFTSVKWPGGVAPTITPTASTGFTMISFVSNGTNWYGNALLAFA